MVSPLAGPLDVVMALFSPAGKREPYPLYELLRQRGAVIPLGPQTVVVGYQECARALRDPDLLSTDAAVQRRIQPELLDHASWQWLTRNMLFSNEPDHERFRRFFSGYFSQRGIAAMRPAIERTVNRLVDRLAEAGSGGSTVDFMTEFAFRLPMAVMAALLGIPEEEAMRFRVAVGDITLALEPIRDPATLAPGDQAMERLAEYIRDLAARRRIAPGDDLISSAVRARDDGAALSEDELVANIMLLLVAGTEAPMDLIGNAVRLLIDHPEHSRALATNPGSAAGFVAETLRFDPAVHALNRVAARQLDFFGVTVPAGAKVTLFVAAGNRDPRRFDQPARFLPERPNNHSLTFSAGAHYCLGAVLARMQTEIALPELARRFPRLALAGPPSYRDQLVQRGYDQLPVTTG